MIVVIRTTLAWPDASRDSSHSLRFVESWVATPKERHVRYALLIGALGTTRLNFAVISALTPLAG
jgi:hypothetical protein